MNWSAVRHEFPALDRWTYLNTATFGQVPNRSKAVLDRHFDHRNELACSDFIAWFDDLDRIRESIGRLTGCDAADIAFIPNASTALALLINGIDWKPGDQILSMEGEFPNQLYYPSFLAAKGVELIVAPGSELLDCITARTRLVSISSVNYSNGYVAPIEQIGKVLRDRGVLFYLDGTQSVGALRVNLAAVQPDLFAVHAYKWLLSPTGAGFAYVAPRLRATLEPSVIGWRSDRDWRSVNALNHGAPLFLEAAEKYEGGMPNFPVLYAMGDAIEMMLEIGPEAIEHRVLELAGKVREIVEAAGAHVAYQNSPIVAARFEHADASALATELKRHGIIVAARHGRLRVSPHFYNNETDLDRFAAVLHQLL